MPQALSEILRRYVNNLHLMYGAQLKTVFLYGSYARHRIQMAKDDLEAAELNLKAGYYRISNNRAYMLFLGLFPHVLHWSSRLINNMPR